MESLSRWKAAAPGRRRPALIAQRLTRNVQCGKACLVGIRSRQQQTQRTLLDWLGVAYGIAKLSRKILTLAELDSDIWVAEVKRKRACRINASDR